MKTGEVKKDMKVSKNGKVFNAHYVVESIACNWWAYMNIETELGWFIQSKLMKDRDDAIVDFVDSLNAQGYHIVRG